MTAQEETRTLAELRDAQGAREWLRGIDPRVFRGKAPKRVSGGYRDPRELAEWTCPAERVD